MSCKKDKWWCSGIHLLIRDGHMQVPACSLKLAITVSEKMPANLQITRVEETPGCVGLLMPQVAGWFTAEIAWLRIFSGIKVRIREGHMPILASVPKLAITVEEKCLQAPGGTATCRKLQCCPRLQ